MAQSDARFGYRAKLARTDHDLSRPFGFTCAPGMELPVFYDLATPGDKYYINHDLTYLRTAPLAAPAMVDVKVHFETFFVPIQMIYEPFENVIYQLKNQRSSLFNLSNMQGINFPVMDYSAFINSITTGTHYADFLRHDAFRLADHFRLNCENFAYDLNNPSLFSYAPNNFPYQVLAYKTIYQYYYRLDDKSVFNTDGNWDKYYSASSPVTVNDDFFEVYQRPWKFDYFTSLYRSPIISSDNMQNILPNGNYSDLLGPDFNTYKIAVNGGHTENNSLASGFTSDMPNSYDALKVQAGVSTAMIRQMFANEKMAMITGRTRKTYDAQVLAHFGVKVPHDVKHDISLIGRTTFNLHVGEVTSLASTDSTPLGELAGKGWALGQGKRFDFEAPCHGVIMTLFCVEPEQRYYGGFDRVNKMVDCNDVPQPEYDRLGNQCMYRYEAGPGPSGSTAVDIIGWKERYYANKRRAPQVTCAFMHGIRGVGLNSYSSYMIANRPFSLSNSTSSGSNKSRPDLQGAFYIPRSAVDELMLVSYYDGWKNGSDADPENWNATPWLAYARDPFIVDSFVKVKKVSWLSKDGEPIYNV